MSYYTLRPIENWPGEMPATSSSAGVASTDPRRATIGDRRMIALDLDSVTPEYRPNERIRRNFPKMTAGFILDRLEARLGKRQVRDKRVTVSYYSGDETSYLVDGSTGWAMFRELLFDQWSSTRIDLWAIAYWHGKARGWHSRQTRTAYTEQGKSYTVADSLVLAFEVKVSRQDWKREMENPRKRRAAMDHSHAFYFAVPENMVDPAEVPLDCGLIYVYKNGNTKIVKKAKRRDIDLPSWYFLAIVARRAELAEIGKEVAE